MDNWKLEIINPSEKLLVSRTDTTWDMHTHDFYEIEYIISGTCVQTINNIEYKVQKGDLIFLKAGDRHSCRPDDNFEIINCIFYPGMVEDSYNTQGYNLGLSDLPVFTRLRGEYILEIEDILYKIEKEYTRKQGEYLTIIKNYILILISLLIRLANDQASIKKSDITHEILSYLDKNYKNAFLYDVAKHFSFNADYFSRYFKKHVGKTFSKYINDKRIREAIRLINHTDHSIEAICYQVGFKEKKQFYRLFKEYTAMTPNDMRKKRITMNI